jgi:hypothetical protein
MCESSPDTVLQEELDRYWSWTGITRQAAADWWACYPYKEDLYDAVRLTLWGGSVSPAIADLLLEALVLDHRHEEVLEILVDHPMCSYQLAVRGEHGDNVHVRLQLALLLGRIGGCGAVEALQRLAEDSSSAVRRQAWASLSEIDPGFAATSGRGIVHSDE